MKNDINSSDFVFVGSWGKEESQTEKAYGTRYGPT